MIMQKRLGINTKPFLLPTDGLKQQRLQIKIVKIIGNYSNSEKRQFGWRN
jgi:hypothetical protein